MSIQYLSQVWEDHSITSRCELLVLLAIADYARSDGLAWPSIDSLALKARCSQRSVQDVISRLISKNKLEVKYGQGPFGTNVYRVIEGGCKSCTPAASRPEIRPEIRPLPAPNPSGTVRNGNEQEKGEGKAPRVFPSEYKSLIEDAEREIETIKGRGVLTDNDRAQIKLFRLKIAGWKNKRFAIC